jgi:hypothetical protein
LAGRAWLSLVAAAAVAAADEPSPADPYAELAAQLARGLEGERIPVSVGSFRYENTELLSPFSALLQRELERALDGSGRFRVITRSHIADLEREGKFQAQMLEPGAKLVPVRIEGVKAIVRGTYHYAWPSVTVIAELAWPESGEIRPAKVDIPVTEARARIWPDKPPSEAAAAATLKPAGLTQSVENVEDIEARAKKVPRDFGLELAVAGARRGFGEGERIAYRVRAARDCHVALFCHQVDKTTVVLFPNAHSRNTRIAAGTWVEIPGTDRPEFQIVVGAPYGADVVQAVACTRRSELHRLAESLAAAENKGGYRGLTRGMYVEAVESALGQGGGGDDTGPVQWSEAHIVVCTYPETGP